MTGNPYIELLWKAAKTCTGLPQITAAVMLLNRSDVQLNWMEKDILRQYIKEGKLHFMARMYGLRK